MTKDNNVVSIVDKAQKVVDGYVRSIERLINETRMEAWILEHLITKPQDCMSNIWFERASIHAQTYDECVAEMQQDKEKES